MHLNARVKKKAVIKSRDERVTDHQQSRDSLLRVIKVTSSSVPTANSDVNDNVDSTDNLGLSRHAG